MSAKYSQLLGNKIIAETKKDVYNSVNETHTMGTQTFLLAEILLLVEMPELVEKSKDSLFNFQTFFPFFERT